MTLAARVTKTVPQSRPRTDFLLFVALAFGFSWAVWIPTLVLAPDLGLPATMIGAFGPAVAAGVMIRRSGGAVGSWLRSILIVRVAPGWYAVAVAIPLAIVAVQTIAAWAVGLPLSFTNLPARVATFVVTGVVVLLIGGGQEEPGWRGWLQPHLQQTLSPLYTSLAIGAVWALWHLPMFWLEFDAYADFSFAVYLPTLMALSVIYTYLWNRTGGSVAVAMVLHAAINASAGLVPLDDTVNTTLDLPRLGQLVMGGMVLAAALALWARHGDQLGRTRTG